MKPKVKFLTVIWGAAYIRRFCTLSLPSFVAPGNLPALAEATDLEVVIMTCRADQPVFDTYPAFQRLRGLCPVRFVEIDDLVHRSTVYGVILTLAYARPIIACGEEMLGIHFLFMNADFVLSDDSLRSLIKPIKEGRRIILGPSFRAISEDVEPLLEHRVDTKLGVLSLSSREMVAMSLPHPHRTTVAKIRGQSFLHSTHPNQFFWKADDHTMLGRYFLIFMLCLKPERVMKTVNSYCDYGLIPELCPSGDEIAMGDSDDFFMLELQERDKETYMLRFGLPSESSIASSIAEWTTKEHRRAATHDIVFHSRDLPSNLAEVRAEAAKFIEDLSSKLPPPVSHAFHPYWVPGVRAWKTQRPLRDVPPELEPIAESESVREECAGSDTVSFLRLSGCHADFQFLETLACDFLSDADEVLMIGETSPLLGLVLSKAAAKRTSFPPTRFQMDSLDPVLSATPTAYAGQPKGVLQTPTRTWRKCLIFLTSTAWSELEACLRHAKSRAAPGTEILLILHPHAPSSLPLEMGDLLYSFGVLPKHCQLQSIGGSLFWKSRKRARLLAYSYEQKRFSVKRLRRALQVIPFALINFYISRCSRDGKPQNRIVRKFTSLGLSIRLNG